MTDKPFTQRIIDRLRREAVVLMPIALAIYSVWPQDVPVTSYKVWAPIVVGALLRQFFTSPTFEVEDKQTDAFILGKQLGRIHALSERELNAVPGPTPEELQAIEDEAGGREP